MASPTIDSFEQLEMHIYRIASEPQGISEHESIADPKQVRTLVHGKTAEQINRLANSLQVSMEKSGVSPKTKESLDALRKAILYEGTATVPNAVRPYAGSIITDSVEGAVQLSKRVFSPDSTASTKERLGIAGAAVGLTVGLGWLVKNFLSWREPEDQKQVGWGVRLMRGLKYLGVTVGTLGLGWGALWYVNHKKEDELSAKGADERARIRTAADSNNPSASEPTLATNNLQLSALTRSVALDDRTTLKFERRGGNVIMTRNGRSSKGTKETPQVQTEFSDIYTDANGEVVMTLSGGEKLYAPQADFEKAVKAGTAGVSQKIQVFLNPREKPARDTSEVHKELELKFIAPISAPTTP